MLKKQFLRFIAVGSFSTLISYGAFYVTLNFFEFHYLVSSIAGFVVGFFIGFICNKKWTFEAANRKHKEVVLKYLSVYLLSLFLSMFCLKILVDFLHIMPELAYVFVIGITTITNFLGIKFLVFKK